MANESFEDRRNRIHKDVVGEATRYSQITGVVTDAIKDHTNATVNYVTDLFDHDHSAADLVKDGLGFWVGCCRRSMKMWRNIFGAVHGQDRK